MGYGKQETGGAKRSGTAGNGGTGSVGSRGASVAGGGKAKPKGKK